MSKQLQLGPFDPGIRLPVLFRLELTDGIVETFDIRTPESVLNGGAAFEGFTIEQGAFKAGRVCCRSSIAHQLAFCQAIEDALDVDIEPEAASFRVLLAELERIASHLEILTDVSRATGDELMFSRVVNYINKLRSSLVETSGNPFGLGLIMPGGVSLDRAKNDVIPVYTLEKVLASLERDAGGWVRRLGVLRRRFNGAGLEESSLPDGVLSTPAFRASGLKADRRSGEDAYGFYRDMSVDVVTMTGGLAIDRLLLLLMEIKSSVKLIKRAYRIGQPDLEEPGKLKIKSGKGAGCSEGPHGAIEYHVVVDPGALIRRCRVKTASADVLSVMPRAMQGTPYDNVVTSLLSFSPCPYCLSG